jgi:hypothetical protein
MTTPTSEAAVILTRVLEALARQSGKTLSQQTRADIERACELLANTANDLDVLDDLPVPRQSPAEAAIDDPNFQRWRTRRYEEA